MITYAPNTASGFQKLSSSAIEIGNIPLITGPIFGRTHLTLIDLCDLQIVMPNQMD